MYNRYIPQSDGSHRRDRVPDPTGRGQSAPQPRGPQERRPPERPKPRPEPEPAPCPPEDCREPDMSDCPAPCRRETSAGNFLRGLLPQGLTTGDLMVIVLLLLIAGDCPENQSTAMLTLALYLFL